MSIIWKKCELFLHNIRISNHKDIRNLRLIKIMKELKSLEDAREEINKRKKN